MRLKEEAGIDPRFVVCMPGVSLSPATGNTGSPSVETVLDIEFSFED